MRHQIPVALLEFDEGGNTLWVHSPEGCTVLRVKFERITVHRGCINPVAHADAVCPGSLDFCIPSPP